MIDVHKKECVSAHSLSILFFGYPAPVDAARQNGMAACDRQADFSGFDDSLRMTLVNSGRKNIV